MKYAVIKTGGKQYKVKEGDVLEVEKLPGKAGESIEFDQVLLVVNDTKILVGQPLVEKAKVKAKVLEYCKGPKVRIAKFKAKSRYRKVKGHRQQLLRIEVENITIGEKGKKVSEKSKNKKKNP